MWFTDHQCCQVLSLKSAPHICRTTALPHYPTIRTSRSHSTRITFTQGRLIRALCRVVQVIARGLYVFGCFRFMKLAEIGRCRASVSPSPPHATVRDLGPRARAFIHLTHHHSTVMQSQRAPGAVQIRLSPKLSRSLRRQPRRTPPTTRRPAISPDPCACDSLRPSTCPHVQNSSACCSLALAV